MKTTNCRNLFILAFPFLADQLGASGGVLGILIATAALVIISVVMHLLKVEEARP